MAGGAWIFIIVVVVILIGAAYSTYSRRGSGIAQRPGRTESDAPAAEGPSRMSAAEDDTEGSFDTHGTR